MHCVDPREIIFLSICIRGGREGEGEEKIFLFLYEEPLTQIEPFEVTWKDIASRPLSLSLGSTPDIILFVEFLLLREVFYFYVLSFMNGISNLYTQTLFQL